MVATEVKIGTLNMHRIKTIIAVAVSTGLLACSSTSEFNKNESNSEGSNSAVTLPAKVFDLSEWKLTLPLDQDNNGKIDEVSVKGMQDFYHPDFFYLDENNHLVFATPNKAATTANSSNTRSELRHMLAGSNNKVKTKGIENNFVLEKHSLSDKYARVGGKLEASLKVDHVATRAGHPDKPPAYSVVVGQIHAGKDSNLIAKTNELFGWGNEPIKIYYKKWPEHNTGSVFWNYERNLAKNNPDRKDIAYPVWGHTWENPQNPGDKGIALGEEFSYVIHVDGNIMHLEFSAKGKPTVKYSIDLTNNVDAYGEVDALDNPYGYTLDWHYFKAGAYNQCSTKDEAGGWYTACPGTGDWATDKANGDYVQVTFTELKVGESTKQAN